MSDCKYLATPFEDGATHEGQPGSERVRGALSLCLRSDACFRLKSVCVRVLGVEADPD